MIVLHILAVFILTKQKCPLPTDYNRVDCKTKIRQENQTPTLTTFDW